jgi:hypothetical protein
MRRNVARTRLEGVFAQQQGIPLDHNPHRHGYFRRAWAAGWLRSSYRGGFHAPEPNGPRDLAAAEAPAGNAGSDTAASRDVREGTAARRSVFPLPGSLPLDVIDRLCDEVRRRGPVWMVERSYSYGMTGEEMTDFILRNVPEQLR